MIADCVKKKGCPDGVDLRTCKYWPDNCPLVHVQGESIYLEEPQQKLFQDIQTHSGTLECPSNINYYQTKKRPQN